MLKVVKFGGSSLASGEQFAKVKAIVDSDPARRAVVVSAPGRRFSGDSKVTDLLYLCNAHLKYDVSFDSIFDDIRGRFTSIRDDCGLDLDIEQDLDKIRSEMHKGMSVDYLVSRGEYLNAKLMAAYLGFEFVDSADWVSFKYDGTPDFEKSEAAINEIFSVKKKVVLPGFYGSTPDGEIMTFSRGGSDVTGAIAAAGLEADVYENWTDVPGILMADPKIVDDPQTIPRVTYDELRELSYMGASVLHEDTVFPVREKNIPVNIRDTNDPEDPGTMIKESFDETSEEERLRFITGITGRRNYSIIKITKSGEDSIAMLRKVLELCHRLNVKIEQIPCGVDSFSLVIPAESLGKNKYHLISAIEETCEPDSIDVDDGISIVAIVGRQMAYRTGISGKIFAALGAEKINIRTIEQGADEINIMVGVFNKDFERTIRVLYDSFAKH